jgi:16S rRNA (adenine1518-N6/adenine1519-N6)-dimethyltransferase
MRDSEFAKKSLGQNFLKNEKVLLDMCVAGEVTSGDTVLEIGPGRGVLTQVLLEKGARVIAVEKDDRLISELETRFAPFIAEGRFVLRHADVLEFFPQDVGLAAGQYKVIANIPYYITGAIIEKFLTEERAPSCMVCMVQKEVAERIVARDGKESLLSISVKLFGTPHKIMNVSRGNFVPIPEVDSAVIVIKQITRSRLAAVSEQKFFEVVKTCFASKRKQIATTLKEKYGFDLASRALVNTSIDGMRRPETLSVEEWVALTRALS